MYGEAEFWNVRKSFDPRTLQANVTAYAPNLDNLRVRAQIIDVPVRVRLNTPLMIRQARRKTAGPVGASYIEIVAGWKAKPSKPANR